VFYVPDARQAFFIGYRRFILGFSESEDGITVVENAAAMQVIFLKDLARKDGAYSFKAFRQLCKLFWIKAVFFFGLNGHVRNIREFRDFRANRAVLYNS
jgi:hypothetical protein